MTAKRPTPQGISALLRKAGFERAVITDNSRHHKEHAGGFHVIRYPGGVRVSCWDDSRDPASHLESTAQARRAERHEMEARYAEAIRASGWAVEADAFGLFVSADDSQEG